MKSVKAKLFTLYAITITLVLAFLTFITLYFIQLNKDTNTFDLINETADELYEVMFIDKLDLKNIDRHIDLKNQFLIILKDEQLIFSNQSNYKTERILEEIIHEEHEDIEENGLIELDDFVFIHEFFEEDKQEYEIFLGINENFLDASINDIYESVIILNIIILFVLLIIGYLLINKTIKPLKQILNEVEVLQNNQELDKRIKEFNTGDEFEKLTKDFNLMLANIETSINSIKQFSSDASHELKTPLTVIQGVIEVCKDKDLSKEEFQIALKKIDKEQIKIQNIINSFLILSRLDKEQISKKITSLDQVLFDSIESNLEAIENKNLEIKIDIQEDLKVRFDENYLSIVINNLISNATKYTQKGHIHIEAKRDKNKISLNISDTGIGIKKEDQEKIFDRFYRVDKVRTSSENGIGLGLSIVKKICDKFDTDIKLKSEENKGSSFTLNFK